MDECGEQFERSVILKWVAMQYTLSVLIPSRHEEFLARTVQDLLENTSEQTEILVGLDGEWSDPPIPQHPRVNVVYVPESIGQRGMTNLLCRLSKAAYVAKVDAHTNYDKDWDVKMFEAFKETGDSVTMVSTMRNLHVFDWVCRCGFTHYQDKGSVCPECGTEMEKKMIWEPRRGTRNYSYCFDSEPHFQYNRQYGERKEFKDGIIVGYNLLITPDLLASDLLKKSGTFSGSGLQPSSVSSIIKLLTDLANSHQLSSGANSLWDGKDMPVNTVGFSFIDDSRSAGTIEIFGIGDKLQVKGIATPPIFTKVVKNGDVSSSTTRDGSNHPSISNSMYECFLAETGTSTITSFVNSSSPIPTTGKRINSNVIDKFNSILGGEFVYNEKTSSFHNGNVALIPIHDKDLTETMSLQGSCFMLTREKYWELNICDEAFGSWGSQGIEVAVKTWLSGGRVMCNHKTWYAHMFRTKAANGFGFPYHLSGRQVDNAKKMAKDLFFNSKWDKAIHPLSWLVEKFMPVPGWDEIALDELKKREGKV